MRIRYSISLWNFGHYVGLADLERIVPFVREQGYGIELWGRCQDQEGLYDEPGRRRLKPLVEGMAVSLHTASGSGFDLHRKQIDAAADLEAEVIVLHPPGLADAETGRLDVDLARRAVEYADSAGVRLALENGPLEFLAEAIEKVPHLGICFDNGHVHNRGERTADYLRALKHRIIHLHLQDILTDAERDLPATGADHYIPGTGGIPPDDWRLLADTLAEIDFDGLAVFEIRPRNPFQTAVLAKAFVQAILPGA